LALAARPPWLVRQRSPASGRLRGSSSHSAPSARLGPGASPLLSFTSPSKTHCDSCGSLGASVASSLAGSSFGVVSSSLTGLGFDQVFPSSLAGFGVDPGLSFFPCGRLASPWPSRPPLRVSASTVAVARSLAGLRFDRGARVLPCGSLLLPHLHSVLAAGVSASLTPMVLADSRRSRAPDELPLLGFSKLSLRRSTLQVSTPAPSLQPGWCGVASAEGCHAPRHVPSMPFSTTSTACSTWALRASCSSLPTLGFITFQARSSHRHARWSLPKELPALSRGRAACGARRCRSTTPEGAAANSSRRCCSAERAVSRPIRSGFPNLRRLPAPPSDARPRPLFPPCPSRFPEGSRAELGAPCSVPTFTPRGG
jgi:hypothetical protein